MWIHIPRSWACALAVVSLVAVLDGVTLAHPGHEYKITGTISKVRAQVFDVTEADGTKTAFFIVPRTEVRRGDSKASVADIKVGVAAVVQGIENDKGMIEATLVRISPAR